MRLPACSAPAVPEGSPYVALSDREAEGRFLGLSPIEGALGAEIVVAGDESFAVGLSTTNTHLVRACCRR